MEIKINEKLIRYNYSDRQGQAIKYIVIHDTGNTGNGADAEAHFKFFDRANRGASAHYFVDDKQILRVIRDKEKSWHCGDGKGKYGITNENSIGIEMCINSDGDFDKTYKSTISLVKYLMEKYNISLDRVVRHYDASRKSCPNLMISNNWSKWHEFKRDLKTDYKQSIKLLYKNLFGRDADTDGLNYWDNKLNSGLTFGDMLKIMGESAEFKERYINF